MKKQLDLLMLFETPIQEYWHTKTPCHRVCRGILGDVLYNNNPNQYDVSKLITTFASRLFGSFSGHYKGRHGKTPLDFLFTIDANNTLAQILDVLLTNLPNPLDYHLDGYVRRNNPLLKHLLEIYTSEEYQTLRAKAKGAIC